jgi:hypothetical protein
VAAGGARRGARRQCGLDRIARLRDRAASVRAPFKPEADRVPPRWPAALPRSSLASASADPARRTPRLAHVPGICEALAGMQSVLCLPSNLDLALRNLPRAPGEAWASRAGSALRAVRPPNPHITPITGAISFTLQARRALYSRRRRARPRRSGISRRHRPARGATPFP